MYILKNEAFLRTLLRTSTTFGLTISINLSLNLEILKEKQALNLLFRFLLMNNVLNSLLLQHNEESPVSVIRGSRTIFEHSCNFMLIAYQGISAKVLHL